MPEHLIVYAAVIFAVAMVGGIIALIRQWSDELLHMFISFGAGIFLGTVFLHLLPEAFESTRVAMAAPFVLLGYLLVFFIEKFLFAHRDGGPEQGHMVISISAFVGLSIHSFIEGLGLAVASEYPALGSVIFISILAHKMTASFSLTSLFVLAKISTRKSLLLLTAFSLMAPVGALLMAPLVKAENDILLSPLVGLTSGTFLYVAVGELLPEVFHTRHQRWLKLALLFIGAIIMGVLSFHH